jgi:hypothetical protein
MVRLINGAEPKPFVSFTACPLTRQLNQGRMAPVMGHWSFAIDQ